MTSKQDDDNERRFVEFRDAGLLTPSARRQLSFYRFVCFGAGVTVAFLMLTTVITGWWLVPGGLALYLISSLESASKQFQQMIDRHVGDA